MSKSNSLGFYLFIYFCVLNGENKEVKKKTLI